MSVFQEEVAAILLAGDELLKDDILTGIQISGGYRVLKVQAVFSGLTEMINHGVIGLQAISMIRTVENELTSRAG